MDAYSKSTSDLFPDLCDQRIYGINTFGLEFEVLNPNIVNNVMVWSNSLNGWKNRGWERLVRSGLSATTPMTGSRKRIKARKCVIEVSTKITTSHPRAISTTEWKGYPLYGFPTLDQPAADVITFVRNAALAKFLSNAAKDRNDSQYGETLGEWKETVRAVTNPLGALRNFIIRWRRSSRKRLRKFRKRNGRESAEADPRFRDRKQQSEAAAKALAGTWLEFNFGWIPLVKSTNEAVKAMLDRWDRPERKITQGKAGTDYNGSNGEANLFTKDMIRVTQGVETHSHFDHKYRACMTTGAVNGTISVPQTLGLLPEDWAPTLYELFPFSFVLDYFLQVGDLVNAMSFRRSRIIWGTSTQRTFTRRTYSVPIIRVDPSLGAFPTYRLMKADAWGGDAVLEVESVTRADILQVSLLPDLFWHLPFNRKPWANLAALFTSNFARGI